MRTLSIAQAIGHKNLSQEDLEVQENRTKKRTESLNWIRTKTAQQASSQRRKFSRTSSTRQQHPRIKTIGLLAAARRQ
jgi:hypothetical protein